jgi:hypothetical protein
MNEPADLIAARQTDAVPAEKGETHIVLLQGAESELAVATREQLLVATRAAALVAVRQRAENEAAEARLKAERAREVYEQDAAAARARLDEAKEIARGARHFAEADRTRCKVCHAQLAERSEPAVERSDELGPLGPTLGRVCSAKCAATLEAQVDDPAAAMSRIDAAVEAARRNADDATHEAAEAENRVALTRFDRTALRDHVDELFRASAVAAAAERAAEAIFQQAAQAEKKAATEAATDATTEALLAASDAAIEAHAVLRQRELEAIAAERAATRALHAWDELHREEAEARHADGHPWPKRHCLSCELPVADPDARFCKNACARAGRNDSGLDSGAFRCGWCRRTFVAPEDTVWPEDESPVCSPECLDASPVDFDAWVGFVWPAAIIPAGPAPVTAADRRARARQLAAAARKLGVPARTGGEPSVRAARPVVDPGTAPRALPDPGERARSEGEFAQLLDALARRAVTAHTAGYWTVGDLQRELMNDQSSKRVPDVRAIGAWMRSLGFVKWSMRKDAPAAYTYDPKLLADRRRQYHLDPTRTPLRP